LKDKASLEVLGVKPLNGSNELLLLCGAASVTPNRSVDEEWAVEPEKGSAVVSYDGRLKPVEEEEEGAATGLLGPSSVFKGVWGGDGGRQHTKE